MVIIVVKDVCRCFYNLFDFGIVSSSFALRPGMISVPGVAFFSSSRGGSRECSAAVHVVGSATLATLWAGGKAEA